MALLRSLQRWKSVGGTILRALIALQNAVAVAGDKAVYTAAIAEEAHAHYDEPFGIVDLLINLIQGFFQALEEKVPWRRAATLAVLH